MIAYSTYMQIEKKIDPFVWWRQLLFKEGYQFIASDTIRKSGLNIDQLG